MSKPSHSFLLVILISAGSAYSSSSFAQPEEGRPSGPASAHHTAIDGKFARYIRSPKNDIDGIVLEDGTVARFAPHAIPSDITELQSGDSIRVVGDANNGPSERTLIHASVTKGNVVIVRAETPPPPPGDPGAGPGPHRGGRHGPKGDKDAGEQGLQPMTVTGKIQGFSTEPRGRVDGILFVDGTSARAGKKAQLETLGLKVGDTITVTGQGGSYPQGKLLHIETVKLPNGELRTLERPRAKLTAVSLEGEVAHILLSPRGDVDGLLLKDGTHIQLRPRDPNPKLVTGSKIRADGEGTASFVRTDKLTLVATGVVLDSPPPPEQRPAPRELATLEDSSTVLGVANSPEGKIDTLVLQDGSIVQLPPRLRDEAGDAIKIGTKLTVRGDGGTYDKVNALRADYVRLASGQIFTQPKRVLPLNSLSKKLGQEP